MTNGMCLCGAVQYSVSGEPNWSAHCHCRSCRRNSGSAVASFVSFAKSGFTITRGQLSDYESSPGVTRSFCNKCGTPMTFKSDQLPAEIHLFLGTLENPQDYPAQLQVFCAEKLPWLSVDEHILKCDTLPTE